MKKNSISFVGGSCHKYAIFTANLCITTQAFKKNFKVILKESKIISECNECSIRHSRLTTKFITKLNCTNHVL